MAVVPPVTPETAETAESSESTATGTTPVALAVPRRFTLSSGNPFAAVTWNRRDVMLESASGETIFAQRDVEAPASWSDGAVRMVATKYFRGRVGTDHRETSVRQLVARVVETVTGWGREDGVFASREDADAFRDELAWLVLHQRAAFNSPVWFNVGVEPHPQCSACFINSVDDTMESILGLARTEGMLFKYGSGSGSNLSSIRSSREGLSNGGTASGPVSFMRGLDAFAGAIKSGGKTRRAAKMVILDADHPDVLEFVRAKALEEGKARALIAAGYDGGFDSAGGAYESLAFQNANHSVRLPDELMRAAAAGEAWPLRAVTTGETLEEIPARDLLHAVAEGAWACGDPGVQFSTTIDDWNTCPASGPIRASNPCSEFLFLDDTACNLASLNLLAFWSAEEGFDAAGFVHACEVVLTAQEILVDRAAYPTPRIAESSRRFRPLGLGFANLGALLMANGLPYDSAEGRAYAGAVMALMQGAGWRQSAELARVRGPFPAWSENREAVARVAEKHRSALTAVEGTPVAAPLLGAARDVWAGAIAGTAAHGIRNAQITALAPTGTIAFMMDCDTTGVEPDLALVKRKRLVGGGALRLVNRTVPVALERLGYGPEETARIVGWIEENGTVEGCPDLAAEHLPVFDCALPASPGGRTIEPRGHLAMLAALQPFVSGGISKTVNVPTDTGVEELGDLIVEAWRLGIKAVAFYRDGCKGSQPLSAGDGKAVAPALPPSARRRLPDERRSITHKFSVGQHEGYLTVGLYEDGSPGEIFLVMAKEGSTISGLMDAFATAVSIALQYGVPLSALVDKFCHTRFEPSGFTRNPEIPFAKSVTDYIFRWLASKFLDEEGRRAVGVIDRAALPGAAASPARRSGDHALGQQDAPPCHVCGAIMERNGTCYRCPECGATSGCS